MNTDGLESTCHSSPRSTNLCQYHPESPEWHGRAPGPRGRARVGHAVTMGPGRAMMPPTRRPRAAAAAEASARGSLSHDDLASSTVGTCSRVRQLLALLRLLLPHRLPSVSDRTNLTVAHSLWPGPDGRLRRPGLGRSCEPLSRAAVTLRSGAARSTKRIEASTAWGPPGALAGLGRRPVRSRRPRRRKPRDAAVRVQQPSRPRSRAWARRRTSEGDRVHEPEARESACRACVNGCGELPGTMQGSL
eukprot:437708-Hanusia_phi.AAC.3